MFPIQSEQEARGEAAGRARGMHCRRVPSLFLLSLCIEVGYTDTGIKRLYTYIIL